MLHLPSLQEAVQWLQTQVTGALRTDSRKLQPGDGFLAWPGAATDARQHVAGALAAGAAACLVEQAGAEAFAEGDAFGGTVDVHAGGFGDAVAADDDGAFELGEVFDLFADFAVADVAFVGRVAAEGVEVERPRHR